MNSDKCSQCCPSFAAQFVYGVAIDGGAVRELRPRRIRAISRLAALRDLMA